MHFSKFITAIVVIAATGALASPYGEESHDLAGGNQEIEGLNGGMDAAEFDSEMDFSPLGETSLESAMRGQCHWGRCLSRFRRHRRRCRRLGYRVVRIESCGWWSTRALCCRYRRRHRWVHGDHEDEKEASVESSEHELDELDE